MGLRTLVVGCGGIGGVLTARLTEGGYDVSAVSRNVAMREAVSQLGLTYCRAGTRRTVPAVVLAEPSPGTFDLVILTTQPTDVQHAAEQFRPVLSPDGKMVVLQNGLCEERVAAVLGDPGKVIGGVVSWGGTVNEPGVVEQTST